MLTVGLLVNPVAGLGGRAGLKGSDGADVQARALAAGNVPLAGERMGAALAAAADQLGDCSWLTAAGAMGEDVLERVGTNARHVYPVSRPSTPEDTIRVARAFATAGADLIVFAGGDGTARDVLDAVGDRVPVLGVPAGVKMYSGVFVTSPGLFGEVMSRLLAGALVRCRRADVLDADEEALRAGRTGARLYGEMIVPDLGAYVQHTKIGGREDEDLALVDIVAEMTEVLAAAPGPVVLGPGSTVLAVKQALWQAGTLLGVDVAAGHSSPLVRDVDGAYLDREVPPESSTLVVTFLRGQGFLFGRGNQQITAGWLSRVARDRLFVLATRTKLLTLEGRPLLVDTGDSSVDAALDGLVQIVAGFDDRLLYRVDGRA